jgi:hypothetical protein
MPRYRTKDFATLWQEQRNTGGASFPTRLQSPSAYNSNTIRSEIQAALDAYFASGSHQDSTNQQNARERAYAEQKSREMHNALGNLDQSMHGWLQSAQPSSTEAALARMDRSIKAMR